MAKIGLIQHVHPAIFTLCSYALQHFVVFYQMEGTIINLRHKNTYILVNVQLAVSWFFCETPD
jgi:hypothetical protein